MYKKKLNNKTVFIVFSVFIASFVILQTEITFAETNKNFTSYLSGEFEIPPIETNATGIAVYENLHDIIEYKINVTNISDVTSAHIHQGNQLENGPILVTLFKTYSPGEITGVLVEGNITNGMLEGPLNNKQLFDLKEIILNGTAYTNIHTQLNPSGEIRGQIIISEPISQ